MQMKALRFPLFFLVLFNAVIPIQLWAAVTPAKEQINLVRKALGSLECAHQSASIIGENEFKELRLDLLVESLDKTKTTFGRWGLEQMLHPTTNKSEILVRQNLIKQLVNDNEKRERIGQLLKKIADSEYTQVGKEQIKGVGDETLSIPTYGGLLAYWNPAQDREYGTLFNSVKGLYYRLPFLTFLNNNSLGLESAYLMESYKYLSLFFAYLCLEGVSNKAMLWSQGYEYPGLKKAPRAIVDAAWDSCMSTWGVAIPLPSKKWTKYEEARHAYASHKNEKNEEKLATASLHVMNYGTLADKALHTHEGFKNNGVGNGLLRLGFSAFQTGSKAYLLYEGVKNTMLGVMGLIRSTKNLHRHMVQVSQAMDAMQRLSILVKKDPVLQKTCINTHFNEVFNRINNSEKMLELRKELKKATFKDPDLKFFYRRGRLLYAHKLMVDVKDELIPTLKAVAELDALYGLACIVKESMGTKRPFSFVKFDESKPLHIDFKNSWIPVVENAVPNSLRFGLNHPTKLVITGPNGGGKSTVLKSLGHCAVMAQSWGIVPAQSASMSMFSTIRTCLHPHEDIAEGMSTFMAEKGRVDQIKADILQKRSSTKRSMILLDEPYKGTVDAESAERIYNFGKAIASFNNSIVCIATHVHKPILLAQDTNGAFANRQIVIKELPNGQFKREFRLADGPATWWFEDIQKRSRFVDWLGNEILRVKATYKKCGVR